MLQEMHPLLNPGVMLSASLHPVTEGVKQNALPRINEDAGDAV